MGGPDSLDAVRPFLFNLFSDREIIQLGPSFLQPAIAWMIARKRAPKSRAAYEKIGGKTPLTGITLRQAEALCAMLNEEALGMYTCAAGMRYWHPRTPDTLKELAGRGVKRVLGLSLYPHFSRATSGTSISDFYAAAKGCGLEAAAIESFPDHPLYINALADVLKKGVEEVERHFSRYRLLYSAHSLPRKMVEQGDPYVDHLNRTIAALEKETGIKGTLCYQSRSGPVEWLEPATDVLLEELASKGERAVLVLPISFVSDHIETIYEIDMLYAKMMEERGVKLFRTPSLNDHPMFIRALADMVTSKVKEEGWLE